VRQTLAVVLGGLLLLSASTSALAEGTNLTGRPAPEVTASDGLNGWTSGMSLASCRGNPVVLKFVFAACGACRTSMPEFEALHRAYGPRGVRFVAVALDQRGPMESWWRRAGFTVPVALDPSGATSARYGVRSYPTTYVVGADGTVVSYQRVSAAVLDAALLSVKSPRPATEAVRAMPAPAAATPSTAVPVSARLGAPGSSSDVIDPRGLRNAQELGDLPPALSNARGAALVNDYGQVLRVVEAHMDPAVEAPDVVAAATRVRGIALRRYETRLGRIETRWRSGDSRGAYLALLVMARDFHDTTMERPLVERAHRVYGVLTAR